MHKLYPKCLMTNESNTPVQIMVNFYALDPVGKISLIVKVDAQGNDAFEEADKNSNEEYQTIKVRFFKKFNLLYLSCAKLLGILKIPGYPDVLVESIDSIQKNGTINFSGCTKTCDVSSNIVCYTKGTLKLYSNSLLRLIIFRHPICPAS